METDIRCKAIYKHSNADIAIIEVEEVPNKLERFSIYKSDFHLGMPIHCFGIVSDLFISRTRNPFRVIAGIVQRDFIYDDSKYRSLSLELSSPIPKGLSGGPAFIATQPEMVVGISIATIQSEIIVSNINEYEEDGIRLKEKISEFVRYGVILRIFPLIDWINSIIGGDK